MSEHVRDHQLGFFMPETYSVRWFFSHESFIRLFLFSEQQSDGSEKKSMIILNTI
jgi:hypothetical protein